MVEDKKANYAFFFVCGEWVLWFLLKIVTCIFDLTEKKKENTLSSWRK